MEPKCFLCSFHGDADNPVVELIDGYYYCQFHADLYKELRLDEDEDLY